ncbi:hypothetical protein LBMAG56_01540 [Verrucomicrobiota bacterium]|nr:hypothetical protein LBMAG56_01540 [Verrucomicrobiota bacterium]
MIWDAAAFPKSRRSSDGNDSQIIVKAGDFVFVNEDKSLVSYRYDDGSRVAEYPLPSIPVHNGIAIAGGRVIVCCHGGEVVAFASPSARP